MPVYTKCRNRCKKYANVSEVCKKKYIKHIHETYSIDGVDSNDNPEGFLPNSIANSLSDLTALEFISNVELMDIITRADLSEQELMFIELRLEGMTMEYISERLEDSAYKVRTSIQKKLYAFTIQNEKKTKK